MNYRFQYRICDECQKIRIDANSKCICQSQKQRKLLKNLQVKCKKLIDANNGPEGYVGSGNWKEVVEETYQKIKQFLEENK